MILFDAIFGNEYGFLFVEVVIASATDIIGWLLCYLLIVVYNRVLLIVVAHGNWCMLVQ